MQKSNIYIITEQQKLINRNAGSYQLAHMYDKLLVTAISSSEHKLSQRTQQQLPKGQQLNK